MTAVGAPQVTDLSVSRVKLADKCMRAYGYQYVQQVPAPSDKASKVFGIVVHSGLERWYADDYHKQDLWTFVEQTWWEYLPRDVAIALRHCLRAEEAQDQLAQAIVAMRGNKAPRQTKAFLQSKEFKAFEDARDELLAAQEKSEEMAWPKDENAFQAYQKTKHISGQLQARWQHRPPPLVVERAFSIEFAGLRIRGRIDQIRADPDPQGEVRVEGLDVKTGRNALTQMDAFLQAFLYNEACLVDSDLPTPDYWTFLLARRNEAQHGRIDRDRLAPLAERILLSVKRRVESEDFAPHMGMWCASCDFRDLCEAEIGIWEPGTNGLVLGASDA